MSDSLIIVFACVIVLLFVLLALLLFLLREQKVEITLIEQTAKNIQKINLKKRAK